MKERGRRVMLTGIVVSDAMDKTVVVKVERTYRHRFFGRVVRSRRKYMAHDSNNRCRIGDKVTLTASAPSSRHKRWRVVEILK